MTRDELHELRARIAGVDHRLFELLRERMTLSEAMGRVKVDLGLPISVREIETQVLTRARDHAAECGVDPSVMEAIFQGIVRGSVERQHAVAHPADVRERPAGAAGARDDEKGGRVLVVGAAGGMGRFFRALFERAGRRVDGVDPAHVTDVQRGEFARLVDVVQLDAYDAILVAVPLAATPIVLDELTARRPRGRVVEITSIKAHLEPSLERARANGVEIVCLHPMFGPLKPLAGELTFAVACRGDEAKERETVAALLAHPSADIVTMPFVEHDRRMGWLLGLAHLTGMVFASALARSGLDAEDLERCASTTYARQKATASSILSEDPGLYLDIQRLNPHREAVYEAAGTALIELADLVRRGDREGFEACLARAKSAIGS